jgi:hypothetical protein
MESSRVAAKIGNSFDYLLSLLHSLNRDGSMSAHSSLDPGISSMLSLEDPIPFSWHSRSQSAIPLI